MHLQTCAEPSVSFARGFAQRKMSSAATAIFNKPTTIFWLFPDLKRRKPIPGPQFLASKSAFFRDVVPGKSVSWNISAKGPNTMTESIETRVLTGSASDDGVRAFEQEAFVDVSSDSEFRPNFAAGGLESTLNGLSKWLVAALFGTVILWRHDAEALWAAAGSVINAGLSTTLKQILNQERPVSTLRSDPGMPSSHAQSIFFTVTFTVISMVQWLGVNVLSVTLGGLFLAVGSYLSWLRVLQQLHTISQVVVGAMVGLIFCFLWFWSWDAIVLDAFISYLWVRIVVDLGAAGLCLGFLLYVIRYWVRDEQ